ncbi:phosphoadenylyl-sulfate reductase [Ahrensia marina]|uniref:phosphoadenylyl-sulfate reductase n=1 Tax=Ahrensia marina TaxID=1514904 RepID=UPI0035D0877F
MPPASSPQLLNDTLAELSLGERIGLVSRQFDRAVFTTSLGLEDQLITSLVAEHGRAIQVVTLQTGRLFPETLELLETTEQRYGLTITRFEPDTDDVETYVDRYGLNGFYESIEARKACCHARKVVPLAKALEGAEAWITGLRRDQSDNRKAIPFAEWDGARGLMKLNPLADVTSNDLKALIAESDVPTNPLHARGYPSIGCEPCTRAIKPGEPERAGRWWWEQESSQECGLHPDAPPTSNTTQPILESVDA